MGVISFSWGWAVKSVSIRNLREKTYQRIREAATERGISINRMIVQALDRSFRPEKQIEFDDLDDLFGTWSQEEFEQFSSSLDEQRAIDHELWQ